MARFKLTIEYAGTRYSGWQVQRNARTVAGAIEDAVVQVSGREDFELYGAGRTDAGVHALGQVAHLDLETRLGPQALLAAVNDALPADINVLAAEKVTRRFHARHDALARIYLYQIARRRTAFLKPFVWWVREPLDVARLHAAAQSFVGMHDFRAFSAAEPEDGSSRVLLESLECIESGELLLLRVRGSHFLWRMVRRLVGVLVEVGRGNLAARDVQGLMASGASELPASLTAPAAGLFLEQVLYPDAAAERPVHPPAVGARTRPGVGYRR